MGSTSQPGPGVYVGAVCMVEAPESQGRSQQDLGCLSSSTTQRQTTPQAEFGCSDTKHIAK